MKIYFLAILTGLMLSQQSAIAQQYVRFDVEWLPAEEVYLGGRSFQVPVVDHQVLNHFDPYLSFSRELSVKKNYEVKLQSIAEVPANKADLKYIEDFQLDIPNDAQVVFDVVRAGTNKMLSAAAFPYFKKSGQVFKIRSMEFTYAATGVDVVISAKDVATESVLRPGSGVWHKVSVTSNGIYKVDYNFLLETGLISGPTSSAHIHLFGNGEGVLPVDNDEKRTDDLAMNAIQMLDGGDGIFGSGDYFLFYGRGPHQMSNSQSVNYFVRQTNPYSLKSYYFINIDPVKSALRISDQTSSAQVPNQTATQFDHVEHHEIESLNLMKGGQRWYGELFDSELSQTFNFSFPNIDPTEDLSVRIAFAANPRSSGNSVDVRLNGNLLRNISIGQISTDYRRIVELMTTNSSSSSLALNVSVNRQAPDMLTYLDYITLQGRRLIKPTSSSLEFRDLKSVGPGNVTSFTVQGGANFNIWEITNWQQPKKQLGTTVGSNFSFVAETDSLRSYIAFNSSAFKTPESEGNVGHQNLHGLPQADYIIVSPAQFMDQAKRLANLHRDNGLTVHVVDQQAVFNEFSSGMPDPVAIRSFVKMFYDRGLTNGGKLPKYLLMFGDGIYDNRGITSKANYLLTYQVENSENHISAMVADDFFGFLDDNEGFGLTDKLDVGIGRLLISSDQYAKEQVDKIEHYMNNGSEFYSEPGICDCPVENTKNTFGDWRTKYVQIADDEQNGGVFITQDTEPQVKIVEGYRQEMNVDKIYLDAYEQITTAGGQRYPQVNEAINDRIRRGTLVMNYVGHGGEVGVAEERVITVPQIQAWRNSSALPLIVSATCEFTKYDDPDRVSAGEWVSLNPVGGAIALMTTTRSVFISVNTQIMKSFYREVFRRNADSLSLTFGEIIQRTKNGAGSISDNSRSFTLIGDPALRLAMPQHKVVMDSIYREGSDSARDTVRALDKVTVVGHLEDQFGNALTSFNGVASPTLYDKPKQFFTLGQDEKSSVLPFELQKNALYKGQASVQNGVFQMTFIVPKDIDYNLGHGKLSMYAHNNFEDAMGVDDSVVVGGINPEGLNDDRGPDIDLYMNDLEFVNGGLTNESPMLIARLFDENGINAVGNGIGHDITAVLDAETGNPIVLNEYYLADLDTYQSGEVRYRFNLLEPGMHTITFKAWDVNNNSSEATLEFEVKEESSPALSHVLNYPNPFTTKTHFYFEHNQVNTALETQVQIFTVSGRLVKTINQMVTTTGFRSAGIEWDGKDEFGDQLAKGVYVYRIGVETPDGEKADAWEKLVILK